MHRETQVFSRMPVSFSFRTEPEYCVPVLNYLVTSTWPGGSEVQGITPADAGTRDGHGET